MAVHVCPGFRRGYQFPEFVLAAGLPGAAADMPHATLIGLLNPPTRVGTVLYRLKRFIMES